MVMVDNGDGTISCESREEAREYFYRKNVESLAKDASVLHNGNPARLGNFWLTSTFFHAISVPWDSPEVNSEDPRDYTFVLSPDKLKEEENLVKEKLGLDDLKGIRGEVVIFKTSFIVGYAGVAISEEDKEKIRREFCLPLDRGSKRDPAFSPNLYNTDFFCEIARLDETS